ncbi:MAG: hypothetical protein J3K34DRAFT_211217 [Monoraphidium minutum]|nr:MAG: hypothetical protein J3K34DRAFT_211217 [Monoraphidium minutum]
MTEQAPRRSSGPRGRGKGRPRPWSRRSAPHKHTRRAAGHCQSIPGGSKPEPWRQGPGTPLQAGARAGARRAGGAGPARASFQGVRRGRGGHAPPAPKWRRVKWQVLVSRRRAGAARSRTGAQQRAHRMRAGPAPPFITGPTQNQVEAPK